MFQSAKHWTRGYLLFVSFIMALLIPAKAFALTCSEVRQLTGLYFSMHYSFNSFDDELSKRTLSNFLKIWDSGKSYFFQSDIDEIRAKFETKLDDQINKADCSAISFIVNRYSKRFSERQKYIYKLIERKYDFTKDESMIIDRKKLKYTKNVKDMNERWRKKVKFQILSLKSGMLKGKELREKLKKRYELALKRHNEITQDKIYGYFLNAFATALDPHTTYMPADELEDFRIRTRLSLEGIGSSLRSEDGFTIVVSLVKGGAAQKGGLLKTNDKIIAVAQGDGGPVDVIDMELSEVVKLIRGARGTTVKLTVIREKSSESKKIVIPIVRERIQLVDSQASSRVFEIEMKGQGRKKIGVITLPSFYIDFEGRHKKIRNYRSSSNDTKREIEKLKKKNVSAIIVDLRSNGGGSLEESIFMSGLFFDEGPVVQVKVPGRQTEVYRDRDSKTYYAGPLVVMINRHSASASEIFAGAIKDYERGLVIGDSHTFGKGTVQNLNDVAPTLGAVKVTINKFYRPSGASTQSKGVASDIRLPSLIDELDYGEKAYDYALPWEEIAKVKYKKFGLVSPYIKELDVRSKDRIASNEDFKKVAEEIEKYRKNEEERSRVSLMEKKKEDAVKEKEEEEEEEEIDPAELHVPIEKDYSLQETLKITGDYIQMLQGKKDLAPVSLLGLKKKIKSASVKTKK